MARTILNEYDDTKKMLNVLRNFKAPSKTNITERRHYYNEQDDFNGEDESEGVYGSDQPQENEQNDVDVINDVDVKLISSDQVDMTLTDEQKTAISGIIDSFREQVSQTAELEPGFTFSPNEIRLDGIIPEHDLNFTYITGQNAGLYVNAEMLNITQEIMDTLTKMLTYNKQITDSLELMLRQRRNN
jgi:hypothetical protein